MPNTKLLDERLGAIMEHTKRDPRQLEYVAAVMLFEQIARGNVTSIASAMMSEGADVCVRILARSYVNCGVDTVVTDLGRAKFRKQTEHGQ